MMRGCMRTKENVPLPSYYVHLHVCAHAHVIYITKWDESCNIALSHNTKYICTTTTGWTGPHEPDRGDSCSHSRQLCCLNWIIKLYFILSVSSYKQRKRYNTLIVHCIKYCRIHQLYHTIDWCMSIIISRLLRCQICNSSSNQICTS